MKKTICVVFLLSLFLSCNTNLPDDLNTFPYASYDDLINNNSYEISNTASPLKVINLFINELGYGSHDIIGTAKHTESTSLVGINYSETINCSISKVNIYNTQDKNNNISSFCVDIINSNNETLSYCYKWQYYNNNAWINKKTSFWCQDENWYKSSSELNKNKWDIFINQL
jgi:hypothetical protein